MNHASAQSRADAAKVLASVVHGGRTLKNALAAREPKDRALVQAIVYGCLRHYWSFKPWIDQLLDKPLRLPKEANLLSLIHVGLYQITAMRVPDHAAVSETVTAAKLIGRKHAAGLVNAVLRKAMGQYKEGVTLGPSHPQWLMNRLQEDWPKQYESILDQNDQHPPLWLRLDTQAWSAQEAVAAYQKEGLTLTSHPCVETAWRVEPTVPVAQLPGFEQGRVSVQDPAAQLAAQLLRLEPGLRVLDACAAPGGKTCHLVQHEPELDQVIAVDSDADRLTQVDSNLARCGLSHKVTTKCADVASMTWQGPKFHRILLDAPCSGTGVIRRHPDIKVLRRPEDIDQLARLQAKLLDSVWQLLRPGGVLVYATCSILRKENEQQIQRFVDRFSDVIVISMADKSIPWGQNSGFGRQILPGEADMDGFYYACLQKS